MAPPVTEGYAPFPIPGVDKETKTYYKVVGDLAQRTRPPLIALHGGPGFAHDYLLPLSDLAAAPYGVPVVFYDQIGGGRSTHLPERAGDVGFWTEQLFEDEFFNLLRHLGVQDEYDVIGHSWGGMLGERIAAKHAKGLRKLVLTDSLADMETWAREARRLLNLLPKEVVDIVEKHEAAGTTEDPEYQGAIAAFFKEYVLRIEPWPKDFMHTLELFGTDPTVYHTMLGPSEFNITGSLKDWSIVSELHKIAVPTLVLNGRYDEATDEVVRPLFEHIPRVRWYTFAESSHMPYWEERERYMKFVSDFLAQK